MPYYDYRCDKCREVFTVERSMTESHLLPCTHCGSHDITRIWNAFILSGGTTQDVGQSTKRLSSKKSGCGSCSSHSCGNCH